MKVKSTVSPENYKIENITGNSCVIVLVDPESIKEDKTEYKTLEQTETQEVVTSYEYDMYRINAIYREDLEQDLQNADKFNQWLEFAKTEDYNEKAKEVRAKRDELLAESDKEVAIDRLGLEAPSGTTFTSWLPLLKSIGNSLTGKVAKYRKELRDITEQKGFPYDVKFPDKP
jgi:hypothetical protein